MSESIWEVLRLTMRRISRDRVPVEAFVCSAMTSRTTSTKRASARPVTSQSLPPAGRPGSQALRGVSGAAALDGAQADAQLGGLGLVPLGEGAGGRVVLGARRGAGRCGPGGSPVSPATTCRSHCFASASTSSGSVSSSPNGSTAGSGSVPTTLEAGGGHQVAGHQAAAGAAASHHRRSAASSGRSSTRKAWVSLTATAQRLALATSGMPSR
jgi:hypothetical protein